uniref:Cytochrome b n=1 Tax=Petrobiona massiliana TaxID=68578 RepID=A0A140CUT3_9METZ|nr:apocytochrome b [Petrobiona massiliana]
MAMGRMLGRTGTPITCNFMWNGGSLLGFLFLMQSISGLVLSMRYSPTFELAYGSIINWSNMVDYGWLLRLTHVGGASMVIAMLTLHIGRALYYRVVRRAKVWNTGFFIYGLSAMAAFLGYVLPWGNMSYWAATVITNVLGCIPGMGSKFVIWLWGGECLNSATLGRFFTLHFLIPLLAWIIVFFHLMSLHAEGSSTLFFEKVAQDTSNLSMESLSRDIMGCMMVVMVFMGLLSLHADWLSHVENFEPANPIITPPHITPDWYFLIPYAVLRSVPHREGGALALVLAVFSPWLLSAPRLSYMAAPKKKAMQFLFLVFLIINLSICGMRPPSEPYLMACRVLVLMYMLIVLNFTK